MRALAALFLLLPASFCAAAPMGKAGVFTPTSNGWVQAIHGANRPGQSQLTLHNFLPGLKETVPGIEMRLVLAPLAQELQASGYSPKSFASADQLTRDKALIAAWDKAVLRVAETAQPLVDKMGRPPAPDPDLPVDTAKLHEIQAHFAGYLNRKDGLLLKAYQVARLRLAAMKSAEIQGSMERIAEALGRTPSEMAVHGTDWLHAWSVEEPGVFPGNVDFWKTPDLRRDDFVQKVIASDALIGGVGAPVHTPNRGGLSPYGARQLILQFDAAASPAQVDEILARYGLVVTSKAGSRVRVAIASTASRERVASYLSTQPEVLSVTLPGKPVSRERQLTVRFNKSSEGQPLAEGDIEMILGLPKFDLRVLEVLPGRTFRLVVGKNAKMELLDVATTLQAFSIVNHVVVHSAGIPAEGQMIVRFKSSAADEEVGEVLGRFGVPVLEALGSNSFRLGIPDVEILPDIIEEFSKEPLILSVKRASIP